MKITFDYNKENGTRSLSQVFDGDYTEDEKQEAILYILVSLIHGYSPYNVEYAHQLQNVWEDFYHERKRKLGLGLL